MSAHIQPKHTWKVDESWTTRKSPPHSPISPKYPFLSRLWLNEKTLTWRARRVETNKARPMAGSLLLFLYFCLKPQLASLQAMLRGACFEAETVPFSDWLVMWPSPTTMCLSPQTQPDILLGGVSNYAHPEFSHTRGQTKVRRPRAGTLNALSPMVPDQVQQRERCPIQYCQGCCTLRP